MDPASPFADALKRLPSRPVDLPPVAPQVRPSEQASVRVDERVDLPLAAHVVEQAVTAPAGPGGVRLVTPPSAVTDWLGADHAYDHDHEVDVSALSTAQLAKEALRARLVSIAEQREHRSTYELVFLMLAFAVMVLLVTPPIVEILLAIRGVRG